MKLWASLFNIPQLNFSDLKKKMEENKEDREGGLLGESLAEMTANTGNSDE